MTRKKQYNKKPKSNYKRLEQKVNKVIKSYAPEKHKMDFTVCTDQPLSINGAGANNCLTRIDAGDTYSQRTGRQIFVKGLSLNGILRINPSATPCELCAVRICVVQDLQNTPDLTIVNIADVLQNVGDSRIIKSPLNASTAGRYKILMNKVFYIDNITRQQHFFSMYKKLSTKVYYNGASANDMQKNQIYVFAVTDGVTVGKDNPELTLSSRIYYFDN